MVLQAMQEDLEKGVEVALNSVCTELIRKTVLRPRSVEGRPEYRNTLLVAESNGCRRRPSLGVATTVNPVDIMSR